MSRDKGRHIASWLLLAVFVPILIVSSLHVHTASTTSSLTECADCVHHNCHGHLSQMVSWSHECVLCQFLTLTFVATDAIILVFVKNKVGGCIVTRCRNICVAHSGIVGLRAPPVFSI